MAYYEPQVHMTPLTLIVVDDEESVRLGLSDLVDWANCGFVLLEAFEDGDEAIAFLKQTQVDVVLTDIVMARTSGLDVATFVRDQCPGTEVVILSGHDDFALAQHAIEARARHYLLKPTDINEMAQLFTKLHAEITARRDASMHNQSDETAVRRMTLAIRQHLFLHLTADSGTDAIEYVRRELPTALLSPRVLENPCAATVFGPDEGLLSLADDVANRISLFIAGASEGLVLVPFYWADRFEILCLGDSIADPASLRDCFTSVLSSRLSGLESLATISAVPAPVRLYPSPIEWACSVATVEPDSRAHVHPAVTQSLAIIERDLEADVRIDIVAKEVSLSTSYFSRLFHASTGTTFAHYVRGRRVDRAKQYLANRRLTIAEISEMVGYRSVKHFYRVFHEVAGTTPASYRRREPSSPE